MRIGRGARTSSEMATQGDLQAAGRGARGTGVVGYKGPRGAGARAQGARAHVCWTGAGGLSTTVWWRAGRRGDASRDSRQNDLPPSCLGRYNEMKHMLVKGARGLVGLRCAVKHSSVSHHFGRMLAESSPSRQSLRSSVNVGGARGCRLHASFSSSSFSSSSGCSVVCCRVVSAIPASRWLCSATTTLSATACWPRTALSRR